MWFYPFLIVFFFKKTYVNLHFIFYKAKILILAKMELPDYCDYWLCNKKRALPFHSLLYKQVSTVCLLKIAIWQSFCMLVHFLHYTVKQQNVTSILIVLISLGPLICSIEMSPISILYWFLIARWLTLVKIKCYKMWGFANSWNFHEIKVFYSMLYVQDLVYPWAS